MRILFLICRWRVSPFVITWPFSVHVFLERSVMCPPLLTRAQVLSDQDPTLMILLNLNYLLKGPISKGFKIQNANLVRGGMIQSLTDGFTLLFFFFFFLIFSLYFLILQIVQIRYISRYVSWVHEFFSLSSPFWYWASCWYVVFHTFSYCIFTSVIFFFFGSFLYPQILCQYFLFSLVISMFIIAHWHFYDCYFEILVR